jgi:hypothetical protein
MSPKVPGLPLPSMMAPWRIRTSQVIAISAPRHYRFNQSQAYVIASAYSERARRLVGASVQLGSCQATEVDRVHCQMLLAA